MYPTVASSRQDDAMVLCAFGIARDILVQHDFDPRQPMRCVTLPAREVQRGEHEEVGRHEGGGRVAGEAEDEFGGGVAGGGFEGDGGEGGGFAGLHGDAAEVDGAAEGALDGRFEEVELAHGDAARGHDDVDGAEGASQVLFERAGSGGSLLEVWAEKRFRKGMIFTCLWRYRDLLLGSPSL